MQQIVHGGGLVLLRFVLFIISICVCQYFNGYLMSNNVTKC